MASFPQSEISLAPRTGGPLVGRRVWFAGKLAAMSRRDAQKLVRDHGGEVVETLELANHGAAPGDGGAGTSGSRSDAAPLAVVGEDGPTLAELAAAGKLYELLPQAVVQAAERGELEILSETGFWQRLGLVEAEHAARKLYTAGMLASLLGVGVDVVRRWQRRGLIRPVHTVRRLAYFDFQEVATARRLAELLAQGASPRALERQLTGLARFVPGAERPLAQLSLIVTGKELLWRRAGGGALVDAAGQMRLDFDAADAPMVPDTLPLADESLARDAARLPTLRGERGEHLSRALAGDGPPEHTLRAAPRKLLDAAARYEDEGDLAMAAEVYRAALAAGGPDAEICFQLADLLYRLGDLTAARERYYMALEIDEEYVEARVNLGCVLRQLGEAELAAAAFSGALAQLPDYPDAHYHLARVLCSLGQPDRARRHWQRFLELAPESPWADEARAALQL